MFHNTLCVKLSVWAIFLLSRGKIRNFAAMKKEPKIISMGHIDLREVTHFSAPNLESLPVLATRNLVLFPGVAIPIALVRRWSAEIVQRAFTKKITLGICCQLDPNIENPSSADEVAPYGVFAEVLQIFDLPDGTKSAFIRATSRFKVHGDADAPSIPGSILNLKVTRVNDSTRASDDNFRMIGELIMHAYKELSDNIEEINSQVNPASLTDSTEIINEVSTHCPASIQEKIDLLSTYRVFERGEKLLKILNSRLQEFNLAKDIMERAREELNNDQREMFLKKQMEVMQREIYGDVDDVEELTKRFGEKKGISEAGKQAFEKGIGQLRRLSTNSPDYFVCYNYLTTLLDLPWRTYSVEPDNLAQAREVLDSEHYGMKKVKERIVEQLAVALNNPDGKAPILCLVGAPGVGKTSLGESVAKALGREYRRVSLGGISDEAEIRGHRRTYIGAMPGRIMDAIKMAKRDNPLLLLDEIDKLGRDHKGDPSSALLEVLDPEQNCRFHDNYIDVDYDLSKVMFIATANTLDTVPAPLLDRMEVVEVPGYLLEEKMEIARRHLIPRVNKATGFKEDEMMRVDDEALTAIIEGYTSESGVRQLEKVLASMARKLLVKRMTGQEADMEVKDGSAVKALMGNPRYTHQRFEAMKMPGVATGLAWTAHGGEILFIESSLSKGTGEKLSLTGNLGDVMKESASIALQYVRSHADEIGIPTELFEKNNLHIHVPEGAVPKDGPSAGITMAVSIASTMTGRLVKPHLAMTGEITLRGRVLPVGGIKEKILAAKRAGITEIILSEENRRDLEEIEPQYISDLTFRHVTTVAEVLAIALQ